MRKLEDYKPTKFMADTSHYDETMADFAVSFIEELCHTKGTWAGKKFELIDWQEQIIRDLFGVLKPNGYRQFNTAYIEIPKKQGKSELAAAVALLLLCGDGEERAEVYGCAADRNQAKIVFDVAVDMVKFSPALLKRVKILESQKKLIYKPTNSFYQVLSADVANKHGFNTHGVIFDELHTQPNRKLYDVMTQGSGDARMQPLYFLITTAGNDTNSICYEIHQKALDIQAGRKVDPTFYSVIYGADESEDWTDPKVWQKANPSLGITVAMEKVKAACDSAKQNPGEENSFRQLRLLKRVKILESQKKLIYKPTNSFYQVLSADVANKHGFNTHGVIFDELHTQPNRKLYDVMTQGSGDARMQPLYFLITTAGNDTNSICYEIHQKALDIQAGRKVDPTFYSVIYGADESEDWTDPKVWQKANPSLGITVAMEKVKAACDSAKQNPGEENSFRQLRLNQWVKQSVRWMPMDKWDACNYKVDEDELEGRICYGGLDLSSTTDITAFVLVFPPFDEEDKYIILPYFWVPEDTLDLRVRRDHVPYDLWERKGYLQTTEGNVVHYGFIEKFIESLGERFNIREIAFDRWGAVQMVQNLEGMGFTVVPFGQGFKDMSPPTKELMKLVLEKKIVHGDHPVLRWNMDNIFIRTDPAGNIKADKEKSTEKIDGAIATIMALDRAIRCGNEVTESVYDTRGLLVF